MFNNKLTVFRFYAGKSYLNFHYNDGNYQTIFWHATQDMPIMSMGGEIERGDHVYKVIAVSLSDDICYATLKKIKTYKQEQEI